MKKLQNQIKKFKNGNINLEWDYNGNDWINSIDYFIESQLEGNNLFFNQINGYKYLVDFDNNRCYEMPDMMSETRYLESELIEGKGKMKLYALSKKESKSLMQDLENGY